MDEALLKLDGISLDVMGRSILRDVCLEVRPKEIHALIGANGSGKSSLARLIMGCAGYHPDMGEILWQGRPVHDLPIHERARLGITLAWQEPARFEGISVGDYLALGKTRRSTDQCLEQVGLDSERYRSRNVDATLSGGERKRIELAAVLALEPQLAILDEPAAGVDLLSLDEVLQVIESLRNAGSAVLVITHREDVAAGADRATQICGGQIVCTGDTQQVLAHYKQRKCVKCNGGACLDG